MNLKIREIKNNMTDNKDKNLRIIKRNKKKLFQINDFNKFIGPFYKEKNDLLFVEAMFEAGFSPNKKDFYDSNLIFAALNTTKSSEFIFELVKLSIEYGLDVNCYDRSNNTILHQCLLSSGFHGNIIPLYNLLKENGFNIYLANIDWEDLGKITIWGSIADYDEFIELYKKDMDKCLNAEFHLNFNKLVTPYKTIDHNESCLRLFNDLPNIYIHEEFLLKVIEQLFIYKCDVNDTNFKDGLNYIMRFLNYGHSNEFILDLINLGIKYDLNINYQNDKGNTIMHHILCKDYEGNFYPIYTLLMNNGFDDTIKNNDDMSIYDLLRVNKSDVWDKEDILDYRNKINNDKKSINNIDLYNLNEINYNYLKLYEKDIEDNWIYRRVDHEYKFNNINLIRGSKGVGKTSYLINLCSRYNLRREKALYITIDDILNNCEYINQFNAHLFKIMRICAENKIVLMIDDIDRIYKNDIKDFEKEEINMFIDMYVKQYGLYLIGTIDDDKVKLFIEDRILSNQINEENLCLPDEDELIDIINYMIKDYSFKDDNIKELFVKLLVSLSNVYKRYNNISNVEIVKSIINNLNNNEIIDIEKIRYSINLSNYLDKEILTIVNEELLNISNNTNIEETVKRLKKKI